MAKKVKYHQELWNDLISQTDEKPSEYLLRISSHIQIIIDDQSNELFDIYNDFADRLDLNLDFIQNSDLTVIHRELAGLVQVLSNNIIYISRFVDYDCRFVESICNAAAQAIRAIIDFHKLDAINFLYNNNNTTTTTNNNNNNIDNTQNTFNNQERLLDFLIKIFASECVEYLKDGNPSTGFRSSYFWYILAETFTHIAQASPFYRDYICYDQKFFPLVEQMANIMVHTDLDEPAIALCAAFCTNWEECPPQNSIAIHGALIIGLSKVLFRTSQNPYSVYTSYVQSITSAFTSICHHNVKQFYSLQLLQCDVEFLMEMEQYQIYEQLATKTALSTSSTTMALDNNNKNNNTIFSPQGQYNDDDDYLLSTDKCCLSLCSTNVCGIKEKEIKLNIEILNTIIQTIARSTMLNAIIQPRAEKYKYGHLAEYTTPDVIKNLVLMLPRNDNNIDYYYNNIITTKTKSFIMSSLCQIAPTNQMIFALAIAESGAILILLYLLQTNGINIIIDNEKNDDQQQHLYHAALQTLGLILPRGQTMPDVLITPDGRPANIFHSVTQRSGYDSILDHLAHHHQQQQETGNKITESISFSFYDLEKITSLFCNLFPVIEEEEEQEQQQEQEPQGYYY